MRESRPKIRVIVRPWVPRKIPYAISIEEVEQVIREAQKNIKAVIYVGWARRVIDGKKIILYVIATGNTASEARNNFKKSNKIGEEVWFI